MLRAEAWRINKGNGKAYIVRNPFPEGWLDQNFYYETNEGQALSIVQNGKKTGRLSPNISGSPIVANFDLSGSKVTYKYVDFVVSRKDTVPLYSDSASMHLDSIVTEAVVSCRSKHL
jgi:hypothetical protein